MIQKLRDDASNMAHETSDYLRKASGRLNSLNELTLSELEPVAVCRVLEVFEKTAQELLDLPSESPGCVSDEFFLITSDICQALHSLQELAGYLKHLDIK